MNARSVDLLLLGAAISLGGLATIAWRRPLSASAHAPAHSLALLPAPKSLDDDSLDDAAQHVIDQNPFRVSHRPAAVPYARQRAGEVAPVAIVRPVLILKGIVGGPPWQAVIDGIPGEPPGTVVKSGSVFDKLLVRSVTRYLVIIQGPDTTWNLSFTARPR